MEGEDWVSLFAAQLEKIRMEMFSLYAEYMFEKDQKEGLTHVQALLMKYLLDKGNSTVSATADYMGVTMAAVSSLVDRLVRGGLICRVRSETDRRVVYISLTAGGREAIEGFLIRHRKKLEYLISKIGKENAELVIKGHKIERDALEEAVKEKVVQGV